MAAVRQRWAYVRALSARKVYLDVRRWWRLRYLQQLTRDYSYTLDQFRAVTKVEVTK